MGNQPLLLARPSQIGFGALSNSRSCLASSWRRRKSGAAKFEEARARFAQREEDAPLAVARPRIAADVQALVRYCANGVDFVIRRGGHDCAGRTQVRGALAIVVRGLDHVRVAEDDETAAVGGGVILRNLARVLDARGLVTLVRFLKGGLLIVVGVEIGVPLLALATPAGLPSAATARSRRPTAWEPTQIIGAKLVNLKGELVNAEDELLKGIRGGGWIFGVIVELTIKAYPLKGTEALEKLAAEQPPPKALQIQHFGIELPNLGKVLTVGATWANPDREEGRRWMGKIASLGNCLMNNPEPQSVTAYIGTNEAMVTYGSYGRGFTVSMRKLTPQQDLETKGADWVRELARDLRESDPDNFLDSPYVTLVGDDDADYRKIYGPHYDAFVALKRVYDPDNAFKYAVPRFFA
ncbi:hypothetical protein DL765_006441 [Monosporascus sp. GIB2]|nr:hypothetical protein DL765_006441 [Monosporascus sp. GIB2]